MICDELHENFKSLPAVQKLDYVSRTSRKRLVSLWTANPGIKGLPEDAGNGSPVKAGGNEICFQTGLSGPELGERALNLTNGQADRILELGGDPSDKSEDRKGKSAS